MLTNRLIRKFLSFSYGGAVAAGIGFITTMLTTRLLLPDEFGKASMFTLFIGLAVIFSVFGTDQAFVRFFYEEEKQKRGALLYRCLKVAGFFLLPALGLLVLFREPLSLFLFGEYSTAIFAALAAGLVVQVLYVFGKLVIRMQQKGHLFSINEMLNRLFILIGIAGLYFVFGPTFEIIIFATVLSYSILVMILVAGQWPYWHPGNGKETEGRHSGTDIIRYSYPLVITAVVAWLFEGIDKLALRQWADFEELGLYAASFKIVALLTILKVAFANFWTPVAYETFEKNPGERAFYGRVSRIAAFAMLCVAIILITFNDSLIRLLGSEYAAASSMLAFLVFVPVMYTISETTVIGINFYKKVKWHIAITGTACAVNAVGNWLLVPQYGGTGAAVATGISYMVFLGLRTAISLTYFHVNYGLGRLAVSTFIVLLLALYALLDPGLTWKIGTGVVSFVLVAGIYRKEWLVLLRNR
ncbi:hypothetical protein CR205_16110 [Alteribacter lacisalsi]|uniref:Polysaccharide biosynthesis protein n=1 Tax=Alteribacter lacisalsi TaxID=2045244 RepID=A0A2W0HG96_9BACI|nr:oligosaccharide flippase family protein [Alteribacter lacisalsi]PYZ95902.1 hypothetical protein CR205_16110 [Alteribacter lacisalsi]